MTRAIASPPALDRASLAATFGAALSKRWTELAGSAVTAAAANPPATTARGAWVRLAGHVDPGGRRFALSLDAPLALALASAQGGTTVATIEEAAASLLPFAAEAAEALAETLFGPVAGPAGASLEPPQALPSPGVSDESLWLRVGVLAAQGWVALDAELAAPAGAERRTPEALLDLELPFAITLGSIEMTLAELQQLETGSTVPLGRFSEGLVNLVVGGRVIARGELVTVDGSFGIRIGSVEDAERRLTSLARA